MVFAAAFPVVFAAAFPVDFAAAFPVVFAAANFLVNISRFRYSEILRAAQRYPDKNRL